MPTHAALLPLGLIATERTPFLTGATKVRTNFAFLNKQTNGLGPSYPVIT
jgi:hypothetical protein